MLIVITTCPSALAHLCAGSLGVVRFIPVAEALDGVHRYRVGLYDSFRIHFVRRIRDHLREMFLIH